MNSLPDMVYHITLGSHSLSMNYTTCKNKLLSQGLSSTFLAIPGKSKEIIGQ